MEKQKIKNVSALIVGLVFVFAIGTTVAPVFSGLGDDIFRLVSAEENESGQNENPAEDEPEDESKDEEDDNQGEQEEKADERQRESTKKANEINRDAGKSEDDENELDDESDEEDESVEDLADIKKDLAKIEERIATLGNNGVDTVVFSTALNEIKNAVNAAEAIADPSAKERAFDQVEDDIERLEKMVKIALGWEDDEDSNEVDDDANEDVSEGHGSVVSQFVQNLHDIADADGGIGKQVRVIAQSQNDSQDEIAEAIDDVEERNGFVKFLIGPNYSGIENVQVEIGANQGRINVLNQLLSGAADPVVKIVLREQIEKLQEENTKLQEFVVKSEEGISLFGWLFRIIA